MESWTWAGLGQLLTFAPTGAPRLLTALQPVEAPQMQLWGNPSGAVEGKAVRVECAPVACQVTTAQATTAFVRKAAAAQAGTDSVFYDRVDKEICFCFYVN